MKMEEDNAQVTADLGRQSESGRLPNEGAVISMKG
jgi:hypothetical protein